MALQWYPGHMTRARRELAELMPSQDLVIEVIDARLPAASTNPVVGELDKYGRTLGYVFLPDGSLYNQTMIADGFAHEREPSSRSRTHGATPGMGGKTPNLDQFTVIEAVAPSA